MLGLKAESAKTIKLKVATGELSAKIIRRVELETRLCSKELKSATATLIISLGSWPEQAFGAINDEIVVISVIGLIDSLTDFVWHDEIKHSILDARNLAGGDVIHVLRGIFTCVHRDHSTEDVAASRQVEIRVVSQVENGLLISLGLITDCKLILVIEAE